MSGEIVNLETGEAMTVPCTGWSANWCPNCGTCTCWVEDYGPANPPSGNCPLHRDDGLHAEGPTE